MTEYIVQINFKDQLKYESNKGFIKDIIKRKHGLLKWDSLGQRWYDHNKSGEVKRLVDSSGTRTIGLKIAGDKELAFSLVSFVKGIHGVNIVNLDNPIDNEVNRIVEVERINYTNYAYNLVERGEMTKERADYLINNWVNVVRHNEYEKRGVEY